MTEIQIHHPCWEIHIVVIPCRLAKHLQATNSSFIFILILYLLALDSNWNTLQQVRVHTKKISVHSVSVAMKKDMQIGIFVA